MYPRVFYTRNYHVTYISNCNKVLVLPLINFLEQVYDFCLILITCTTYLESGLIWNHTGLYMGRGGSVCLSHKFLDIYIDFCSSCFTESHSLRISHFVLLTSIISISESELKHSILNKLEIIEVIFLPNKENYFIDQQYYVSNFQNVRTWEVFRKGINVYFVFPRVGTSNYAVFGTAQYSSDLNVPPWSQTTHSLKKAMLYTFSVTCYWSGSTLGIKINSRINVFSKVPQLLLD